MLYSIHLENYALCSRKVIPFRFVCKPTVTVREWLKWIVYFSETAVNIIAGRTTRQSVERQTRHPFDNIGKSHSLKPLFFEMASSDSLEGYLGELTKCPICLSDLDNPKALPCLHSFCLSCIKELFKDASPGDRVRCPSCSKTFPIPNGGVKELVSHFLIKDLIELKNRIAEPPNTSCPQVSNATFLCSDCERMQDINALARDMRKITTEDIIPFG